MVLKKGNVSWNKGKQLHYKVWNKGKRWSQETKDKISLSKKGVSIKHDKQFKRGMTPWNSGKAIFVNVICKDCRIEFRSPKYKHRKYCSIDCYNHKIVAWNKGVSMSEKQKEKLRKANLGRIPSNKGKPNLKRRGENHHNWKGGISPINEAMRKTIEYKIWRRNTFERDDYTCQWCRVKGCYIEAHHIKRFSDYPNLRFDLNNCITLCKPCHNPTRGLRSGGD